MTQPAPQTDIAAWDGRLSNLLGMLTTELHASEPGAWASRRTRQGYTVAVTITGDGTRRTRISTDDRPEKGNAAAWGRFHEAIEIMVQHLGIAHWTTVAPAAGKIPAACVEFHEPRVTQ